MSDDDLLPPLEAADFLHHHMHLPTSPATLAKLRCVGGGPVYQKFGRVIRYRVSRLREYGETRISGERRSTSDTA
jgi:hypothetical protein